MTHSHCTHGPCRGGGYYRHGCRGQIAGVPRYCQDHNNCNHGRSSWDSYCRPEYCHPTPANVGLYSAPPELYDDIMPPAEAPPKDEQQMDATTTTADEENAARSISSINKLAAIVEHLAAKIADLEKKLEKKQETK